MVPTGRRRCVGHNEPCMAVFPDRVVLTVRNGAVSERRQGDRLGLVSYVAGFGVPALLAVLIFATGLALALATFWTPAFILWGVGYSALGLAFFAFLFAAIYGSKIIVAYLVGSAILGRWTPRVARYKILPLLLGLVIYILLRAIPILGWVIGFVVTFAGLGAIFMVGSRAYKRPDELEAKAPDGEEDKTPTVEEA